MHEESIAQIHASDAFRAFVDSATLANARCADEQCRKDTAQEAEERSEIIRDEAFGRQRNEAREAAKEAEALQYQEGWFARQDSGIYGQNRQSFDCNSV